MVLLLCVAAGFVHLQGQLRLAEQILIVNGLKWEPIELAPDQFRVTVQQHVTSNDLTFFTARIHAENRVEVIVMEGSEVYSGEMWAQRAGSELGSISVTVLYESYTNNDLRRAKLVVEVNRGLSEHNPWLDSKPWYEVPAGSTLLPELKSGVYKRGQAIPLFDLDGKKYTLLVN